MSNANRSIGCPTLSRSSNHGGPNATVRASATGALSDDDVLALDPTTMRSIANAYRWAFDAYGPNDVAFNRPSSVGSRPDTSAPACDRLL